MKLSLDGEQKNEKAILFSDSPFFDPGCGGNSLKQYRPLPVLAAYNETSLSSSLAGTTR